MIVYVFVAKKQFFLPENGQKLHLLYNLCKKKCSISYRDMNTKILQALWTNMCKCSAVYGFRQKWNQGKSTCRIGISLTLQNWLVPGNKTLLASIRQVNPLLSRHSISVLNRRLAFTRLFLQCFYYIICLKLVSCQWNKRVNKQNNNTLTMCYL